MPEIVRRSSYSTLSPKTLYAAYMLLSKHVGCTLKVSPHVYMSPTDLARPLRSFAYSCADAQWSLCRGNGIRSCCRKTNWVLHKEISRGKSGAEQRAEVESKTSTPLEIQAYKNGEDGHEFRRFRSRNNQDSCQRQERSRLVERFIKACLTRRIIVGILLEKGPW